MHFFIITIRKSDKTEKLSLPNKKGREFLLCLFVIGITADQTA